MGIRVGINGFGRIGRLDLRAAWGWSELEFVHINEINEINEWGYANRMVELARKVALSLA